MTTWRLFDRLRRGIGPRLLMRVLLFSVVSTLVLTLSQLYLDYRRDTDAIDHRMAEIANSYAHSLSEGLWSLDRRQLELQIEGILRLPAVRFVEVRETTDRADPMIVSGGAHRDRVAVSHQFPLVGPAGGEQQQLGVLTLEASFDDAYRALREKAVFSLTAQGATIFVVSLFVLYLTHRLVTRHLTTLAGFLHHYDVLRPPPPLSLQRRPPTEKDELDDVVAAFETMRRTLEHAYRNLRESEQQLRDYAETASDWFWATGPAHEFTYVSEQGRAFGLDERELLGKRRPDIAADVAAEPQKWREHMATLERHEPFRDFVYQRRRPDGALRIVAASGKPVFDGEGRFTGYRGGARDITEHRRADESLRLSQLELRRLTGRLLQAQESEARRIARELHDDLGQRLALLTIELDLLRQEPQEAAGQLGARIQELLGHVKHLSSSLHDMSHQLHPSKLEQLGIVAALGSLCKEMAASHGFEIAFTSIDRELPAAIAPDTAVCLYRITQEALRNAVKHGGAQHATVVLRATAEVISLRIADDGIGFDPRLIQGKGGLGLVSMRERVLHLGGQIVIDSQPARGTRLDVHISLREPGPASAV